MADTAAPNSGTNNSDSQREATAHKANLLWTKLKKEELHSRTLCLELHELLVSSNPNQCVALWKLFGRQALTNGVFEDYQYSLYRLLELTLLTPHAFEAVDQLFQMLHMSTTIERKQIVPRWNDGTATLFCCTPSLLSRAHCGLLKRLLVEQGHESLHVAIEHTEFPIQECQADLLEHLRNRYPVTDIDSALPFEQQLDQASSLYSTMNITECWFHSIQWSALWTVMSSLWPGVKCGFMSGFEPLSEDFHTIVAPASGLADLEVGSELVYPFHFDPIAHEKNEGKLTGVLIHPNQILHIDNQALFAHLFEVSGAMPFLVPDSMWPVADELPGEGIFEKFGIKRVPDKEFLESIAYCICVGGLPDPSLLASLCESEIPTAWLIPDFTLDATSFFLWQPSDCFSDTPASVTHDLATLVGWVRDGAIPQLRREDFIRSELLGVAHINDANKEARELAQLESRGAYEPSLVDKALAAITKQDIDGALALLHEAKEHDPKQSNLHHALALCHIEMNDFETALTLLQKEYEVNPANVEALELKSELEAQL